MNAWVCDYVRGCVMCYVSDGNKAKRRKRKCEKLVSQAICPHFSFVIKKNFPEIYIWEMKRKMTNARQTH